MARFHDRLKLGHLLPLQVLDVQAYEGNRTASFFGRVNLGLANLERYTCNQGTPEPPPDDESEEHYSPSVFHVCLLKKFKAL
jgi:hypothetical protein